VIGLDRVIARDRKGKPYHWLTLMTLIRMRWSKHRRGRRCHMSMVEVGDWGRKRYPTLSSTAPRRSLTPSP